MSAQPLVSILIISYNQKEYVGEALTGALEQDYENLEVVIADDGSTDGTAEVILQYAEKYPDRLVPLVGGPNLGITGNSNRALKACKGKYIAFMGGDDVLLPGKISAQVKWMEKDENRVLCGHAVHILRDDEVIDTPRITKKNGRGTGYQDYIKNITEPFPAVAIMVRSKCIPDYGFDERVPLVSDWKMWIDCLGEQGEYGFVEGVYARYRKHEKNITSILGERCVCDHMELCRRLIIEKKSVTVTKLLRRKLAVDYLFLSIFHLRKKKYLLGVKNLVIGLWTNPFSFLQKLSCLLKNRVTKYLGKVHAV